jgi:S-adenosylmethionine synthetase
MRKISIESYQRLEPKVEVIERKGLGHPDSICDALMDRISVELCSAYIEKLGHIVHHNIDKGLLCAGKTDIRFGGGIVVDPMKLIIGDRATFSADGKEIPVNDIVVITAKNWFKENLRYVNPDEVIYQSELKPASPELGAIFKKRGILGSNDTSACVSYAPLSIAEKLVLDTEHFLNSKQFKKQFPETGEDVKVMALRRHEHISLTIAMAFVDRFILNEKEYFRKKSEVLEELKNFVGKDVELSLNMLDKEGKGINGCYLTVTGTSAESADCGEVGRGNAINGLIPLNRPRSSEAGAGKNPVSHVGKIYNVLTNKLANDICSKIFGIDEIYIWMLTKIGTPINQPMVSIQVSTKEAIEKIKPLIEEEVHRALDNMQSFCLDLAKGKFPVC